MKQLTIKYYLIFTFLCVPYFTNGQFYYADSLFERGLYMDAALEYERLIFNKIDLANLNTALIKKANAYKGLGEFKRALQTLQRANLFTSSDSINYTLRHEIALMLYLTGDFQGCLNQLKQVDFYIESEEHKLSKDYLHILSLNELLLWEEGFERFQLYLDRNDSDYSADSIYNFKSNPRLRSKKKAKTLSYFLPGVGQMYAGYIGKGIISSLIQASLIGLGAYSLYRGYFFTGAVTSITLFYSFYFGGIRHAGYLVEQKNQQRISQYNNRVRQVILEIESSRGRTY